MVLVELKIGRHIYDITCADRFMDNGACVQLLTQSKERGTWGHVPNPVLSERAVREISKFSRVRSARSGALVFTLAENI